MTAASACGTRATDFATTITTSSTITARTINAAI